MEHTHKNRGRRVDVWTVAAWMLMILSPFVLLAIVSLITGHNAFLAYPVWNDETDYWRSLYSVLNVGMNAGPSGILELAPAAGNLSVHGLTPVVLYGWFCKLFGLGMHSIVWCNALWISMGALAFCLLLRPRAATALTISALVLGYTPLILYSVTSMTELFNYGFLLLYFAFLFRYHRTRGRTSLVLCCTVTLLGCLYRIPYFVLFLPIVLVAGNFRLNAKAILWGIATLAASTVVYLISSRYTSPYPGGFLYNWLRTDNLQAFIQQFLSHAKGNWLDYFVYPTGSTMQLLLRMLYCAAGLLCLVGSFVGMKDKRFVFRLDKTFLVCACMLVMPFAIVIMLYETNDWSDFRTLAPYLWGVMVALVFRRKRFASGALLACSLAMTAALCVLPPEGAFTDEYRFTPPAHSEQVKQACAVIEYRPDAEDRFENSVYAKQVPLQMLRELHPGMGLQYGEIEAENVEKSGWIWTQGEPADIVGYELVYDGTEAKVYRKTAF